ncbi:MAG: hypothetical protein ACJ78X_09565, partial [Myxococcales bacterium]
VAQALRAMPGARALLVALGRCGSDEDRQRARAAGFDAHVVKPVSPKQLEQLLAGAPGPGGGASPLADMSAGSYTVH